MRSRQNGVLIYLSDTEKQHLVKQAALAGVNVGAFIRKLIMGSVIRPRPPDEYVKLLREINAIGNNINQIAHMPVQQQRKSRTAFQVRLTDRSATTAFISRKSAMTAAIPQANMLRQSRLYRLITERQTVTHIR